MRKQRILVIDHSPSIRDLLNSALSSSHQVDTAGTIVEGEAELRRERHACVVVEVELSSKYDGLQLIRRLRAGGDQRPVVAISGLHEPNLAARCYDAGADGFVAKPFRTLRELASLLDRLLVRATAFSENRTRVDGMVMPRGMFRFAGAVINPTAMKASFPNGNTIALKPKEVGILHQFASNGGGLVHRSKLLAEVWGPAADATSKSLDTYLARLRRVFRENGCSLTELLTVQSKVGWRVAAEAVA